MSRFERAARRYRQELTGNRSASCLWIGPTHRQELAHVLAQLQRQYWLVTAASPDVFLRSALNDAQPLSDPRVGSQSPLQSPSQSEPLPGLTAVTLMGTLPATLMGTSAGTSAGTTGGASWTPELIVVAQTFAGQYTEALLGALSQRWPSVPRVVVAGQWCDGEHRTGRPLRGVTRVAALAVAENWGSHWPWPIPGLSAEADSSGGQSAATANRSMETPAGLKGCALIVSPDAELAAAVAQGLWTGGWLGIWAPWDSPLLIERPSVLIVDLPRGDELQADLLKGVAERYPGVPLVALGAFVRSLQRHRLMKLGATEVLSRPVDLNELLGALGRCQIDTSFGRAVHLADKDSPDRPPFDTIR